MGNVGLLTLALTVDLALWGFEADMRTGGRIPVVLVVASGIVVFGLLYFRRRWPRLTFVVAWSYCVGWSLLLPSYQPFTALLIALYFVARHLSRREALWFLLLAGVAPALNTHDAAVILGADVTDVMLICLLWCVIFGIGWGAGRWGRRAAQATRWREEKLAAEAALALQRERVTLARELHDVLAHSVGSIIFQAAGARHVAVIDPSTAAKTFEVIEACGVRAMHELRDLLGMLNSAADTGIAGQQPDHLGLEAVESLIDLTRSGGLSVTLLQSGRAGRLAALADHAAYRLVQEALTNAVKHGGRQQHVVVEISWHHECVDITVVNSISGPVEPTADSGGYGLAGMRYRVASIGGQVEFGWQSGKTFAVNAQIPVDQDQLAGAARAEPSRRSR